MDYPFVRVGEYALRPGSGGAGARRGGLGFERSYHILDDGVQFATYGDRFTRPAEGLFGGSDGAPAETHVVRGGDQIALRSKAGLALNQGDLLVVRTGGGGGYGDPQDRSDVLITQDLENGLAGKD